MSQIPLEVFTEKWALLNERFGEDKPAEVRDLYYEQIDARLSEAEFVRGVKRVAYANRFFPSPKEIVDAARGGDERRRLAHDDWLVIHGALLGPGRAEDGWTDDLSEAGRKALDLIGGVSAVKNVRKGRVNLLRKDFVRCHRDLAPPDAHRPTLPEREEPKAIEGGEG